MKTYYSWKVTDASTFKLVGLVFLVIGAIIFWKRYKLKMECTAQANGTVIEVRRGFRIAYMEFKYSAGGVDYVLEETISWLSSLSMTKGKSVAVFYDPSDRKRFYIPQYSRLESGAMLFVIVGIVMILLGLYSRKFQFLLLKYFLL